ncbi:MAG: ABC transporter permease subunit [Candidatus Caldarchaeum sp.]
MKKSVVYTIRLLIFVAFVLFWHFSIEFNLVQGSFVARPSSVAVNLVQILAENKYADQLSETMLHYLSGLGLGTAMGFALALISYSIQRLKELITPYVLLITVVPKVIFFPIFVKIFITDNVIKTMFVATLYVLPFTFLGVLSGLKMMEAAYLNLFKIYSNNVIKLYEKILLPASFFSLLASFRLSALFALVGAIFADMMLAPGIGYTIIILAYSSITSDLYALVILIAIVSAVVNILTKNVEDWVVARLRMEKQIYVAI